MKFLQAVLLLSAMLDTRGPMVLRTASALIVVPEGRYRHSESSTAMTQCSLMIPKPGQYVYLQIHETSFTHVLLH
jgi:hypothetical protein